MKDITIYSGVMVHLQGSVDTAAFKQFYNTVAGCLKLNKSSLTIQEFAKKKGLLLVPDAIDTTTHEIVCACLEYARYSLEVRNLAGYTFDMNGVAILFIKGITQEERAKAVEDLEREYKLEFVQRELDRDVIVELFEELDNNVKVEMLNRLLKEQE